MSGGRKAFAFFLAMGAGRQAKGFIWLMNDYWLLCEKMHLTYCMRSIIKHIGHAKILNFLLTDPFISSIIC